MPPNALQTEVANLRAEIASLKAKNAALLAALQKVRDVLGPESFGETVDMIEAAIALAEQPE